MNTYIKTIKTHTRAKARVVISDRTWLESSAIEQLKTVMKLSGMQVGVGMPDLHPGKGQPIGAAFITHNCIYPHLVGSDIGCGMGLWQLDIPLKKIKLDKWEKKLVGLDDVWNGDCQQWLGDRHIQLDSFLPDDQKSLGTIGGGNHFVEFQKVHKVINTKIFNALSIDKSQLFLLVHSGSRGLGQRILRQHIEHNGAGCLMTPEDIAKYLHRHNHAIEWAVANRELIAHRFCESINAEKSQLLDVTHNMVLPLAQDEINALGLTPDHTYWIHRKGASPTNQGLVMIPGSRGSLSYLVQPRQWDIASLSQGGFSLAHGAGRKWKRSDAKGRLQHRFNAVDLERTDLGSRVICKQRDLLYEEAPQAYKNIDNVIDDLVGANMIDVVATFKPVLTYKTRRNNHGKC